MINNKSKLIYILISCIVIFPSLVSASDILVWQGQYYTGTTFNTGTYEFNFSVYDAPIGGGACYSNTTTLTTGNFGEWTTEQSGVNSACNNASKDYFLEIKIDNVTQGGRRRLTIFDFLRKDVNETATFSDVIISGLLYGASPLKIGTDVIIQGGRLIETDDTLVQSLLDLAEETALVRIEAEEIMARERIQDEYTVQEMLYEPYATKVARLNASAELSKVRLEKDRLYALAIIDETKELARLRRLLYGGWDPVAEQLIEDIAQAKRANLNAVADAKVIIIEQELENAIGNLTIGHEGVTDNTMQLCLSFAGHSGMCNDWCNLDIRSGVIVGCY